MPSAVAAPALYLPYPAGVAHRISQGPGGSFSHHGTSVRYAVDFDLATGDPVVTSAPGTVFRAGDAGDGFGLAVYVNHGAGVCTQYAHLSQVAVGVGQVVASAQRLGAAGATGWVTGDHLHWGRVQCDSIYVSVPASTVETGSSFPVESRPLSLNGVDRLPTKEVFAFGDAVDAGSTAGLPLNHPLVGLDRTPGGAGYRLAASDGGIFAFGDARFLGSTGGTRLNRPLVGMATSPTGNGYWLVASDGGIFAYGDARFYGSTGGIRLNQPVVGMAASPTGSGYWLVASDGGIFAFGDAAFSGSTGGIQLNRPIVGMAASPRGGYWFVASDGGIFAYGAPFLGSTGGGALSSPVVGMAGRPTGAGYWLVTASGGIFPFGDAPGLGAPPAAQLLGGRAVAIAGTPGGNGYWVAATR